jgi:hypothetical protein
MSAASCRLLVRAELFGVILYRKKKFGSFLAFDRIAQIQIFIGFCLVIHASACLNGEGRGYC